MTSLCLLTLLLVPGLIAAQPKALFALREGDRVVLLGDALIETEQFHGYLEARLLRHFPGAKVTFRNLGWSGDTVRGDARTSGYQNPAGMARLVREVNVQQPTVLFIGYGMNESFAGSKGLPSFVAGFSKLLDDLAPLKARVVVVSPSFHEDHGRPLPDPTEHNRHLAAYTAELRKLAEARGLPFVDIHHALKDAARAGKGRVTSNGILLNATGYRHFAAAVEQQLGLPNGAWAVRIDARAKAAEPERGRVEGLQASADRVRLRVEAPIFPAPGLADAPREHAPSLRVEGLAPGTYVLRANDAAVVTADATTWATGVALPRGPWLEEAERLREAIVARNEQFYRRWRPFNDHERHFTFLGGDFKLYDEQVAERERVVERSRVPRTYALELVRTGDGK